MYGCVYESVRVCILREWDTLRDIKTWSIAIGMAGSLHSDRPSIRRFGFFGRLTFFHQYLTMLSDAIIQSSESKQYSALHQHEHGARVRTLDSMPAFSTLVHSSCSCDARSTRYIFFLRLLLLLFSFVLFC